MSRFIGALLALLVLMLPAAAIAQDAPSILPEQLPYVVHQWTDLDGTVNTISTDTAEGMIPTASADPIQDVQDMSLPDESGVGAGTVDTESVGSTKCREVTVMRSAKNGFGRYNYRLYLQKNWCGRGGKVTSQDKYAYYGAGWCGQSRAPSSSTFMYSTAAGQSEATGHYSGVACGEPVIGIQFYASMQWNSYKRN